MKLPEFLTEWPDDEIVLTGHRIGLYDVVSLHNEGYTAEMLHEEYPSLPLDLIERVLSFYNENRTEVDDYVAQCKEEMERNRRNVKRIDIEELKRRWIASGRTWNG